MHQPFKIEFESNDFDEFRDFVKLWEVEFTPLNHTEDECIKFTQLITEKLHIGYTYLGVNTIQAAKTPKNTRTIAILPANTPSLFWYRRRIFPNQVLIFNERGEMESHSQSGFSAFTIAIPEEWYLILCRGNKYLLSPDEKVLSCSPIMNLALCRKLKNLLYGNCNQSTRDIEWKVFQMLHTLFATQIVAKETISKKRRSQVLATALEFIHASNYNVPVAELCKVTNTSERTLERIFSESIGISPKQYIKRYLVKDIEAKLKKNLLSDLSIGDIAYKYGFAHHGQFSQSFKLITGVTPQSIRHLLS
ncbi:helix-turn-helix domain-containing protein [Vibrio sp. F74]|uniref:helix-turn-helix domain-containing protein n=1 Tax=Vibrio sp. F74 TaxID=700020 RepID=UPI0035F5CEE5